MLHDIQALIDMAQTTQLDGSMDAPLDVLLAQLREMRDRMDTAIAQLLYLRADLERSGG